MANFRRGENNSSLGSLRLGSCLERNGTVNRNSTPPSLHPPLSSSPCPGLLYKKGWDLGGYIIAVACIASFGPIPGWAFRLGSSDGLGILSGVIWRSGYSVWGHLTVWVFCLGSSDGLGILSGVIWRPGYSVWGHLTAWVFCLGSLMAYTYSLG